MNVLCACEESQAVCKAFRERGHTAFSCDLEPPSGGHPEWHIQDDVTLLIDGRCSFRTMNGAIHSDVEGKPWDLSIAFPPCTYMTNAGAVRMRVKGQIVSEPVFQAYLPVAARPSASDGNGHPYGA